MHLLSDFIGAPLEWKKPDLFKKRFVLVAAGEVEVGTLDFHSYWGSLATARSGDDCWTFERVGNFRRGATIRRCGESEDRGTFRDKRWTIWTIGGTLVMGEQTYRVTQRMRRFEILDEQERLIVHFTPTGLIRPRTVAKIAAPNDDNLTLLILFGWYIIHMLIEDSAPPAV